MEQHHRKRSLGRFRAIPHDPAGERGSVSVTGIVIFFLLLFTMAIGTNWVDNELALGALRATVAQAAEAGSLEGAPGGPEAACQAAASQARGDLISGSLGNGVQVTCTVEGDTPGDQYIVATAQGRLPNWIVPVTPSVKIVSAVHIEVAPTQPAGL
jgi:hypothetical protein